MFKSFNTSTVELLLSEIKASETAFDTAVFTTTETSTPAILAPYNSDSSLLVFVAFTFKLSASISTLLPEIKDCIVFSVFATAILRLTLTPPTLAEIALETILSDDSASTFMSLAELTLAFII